MQPFTTCLKSAGLRVTSGAESTIMPRRRQCLGVDRQRCCKRYMPLLEKACTKTFSSSIKLLISKSCFSKLFSQNVLLSVRYPFSCHQLVTFLSCVSSEPPQPKTSTVTPGALGALGEASEATQRPREGATAQAKSTAVTSRRFTKASSSAWMKRFWKPPCTAASMSSQVTSPQPKRRHLFAFHCFATHLWHFMAYHACAYAPPLEVRSMIASMARNAALELDPKGISASKR